MNRTEEINHRYRGLDTWADSEVLSALWKGQLGAIDCVLPALPAIEAAARGLVARIGERGRIIFVGAGSAGRLAAIEGMELGPTFGWPDERVVLLLAGGELLRPGPRGDVEDDAEAAARRLNALAPGAGDAVIAVAASGSTAFTLAAARCARATGALTIGIANNPGAPLLAAVDHPILLDSGAEVISGSTRMGAGTAQKAALNLLSTLAMIRLGHVYDGLMVDMQPTNAKLTDRSVKMLRAIVPVDEPAARAALEAAGHNVKLAALVASGDSAEQGRRRLDQEGGDLRRALAAIQR